MAYSYEVTVSPGHRELFQRAMVRYLGDRGFAHMRAGGRPGTGTSHEIRRADDLDQPIDPTGGHQQPPRSLRLGDGPGAVSAPRSCADINTEPRVTSSMYREVRTR